jgi:hypothetical protein
MLELGMIDIDDAQMASCLNGTAAPDLYTRGEVVVSGVTTFWPPPPDGARLPGADGCACAAGGWCAFEGVVGRVRVCSFLPLGLSCACIIGRVCSPSPMPGNGAANGVGLLGAGGRVPWWHSSWETSRGYLARVS